MSIRFTCPVCQTPYTIHDETAGTKLDCKVCGHGLQVPAATQRARIGELVGQPAAGVDRTTAARPEGRTLTPPALPDRVARGGWWHYNPRTDEKTAVSVEQLRRMARDGSLRRRDFVKDRGEEQWRRAGRIEGLWPVIQPTAEELSLLTTCEACCGQIAKAAPNCPKCGAPNEWLHPEIVRFLGRLRRFQGQYDGFEAEGKNYTLVGRSVRPKQFLDYAANAVGNIGFFAPLSLSGLAILIGGQMGSQYAAKALADAAGAGMRAFVIDFRHRPPLWNTTDDEFWEDVLDFFDVL